MEWDLKGDLKGDNKGDIRGDFKQDLEGDCRIKLRSVQVDVRSGPGLVQFRAQV